MLKIKKITWQAKVLKDRDFLSGLLFLAIGVAARCISHSYPIGSLREPGSGAFPMLLSWGLMGVGGLLIVRSLYAPKEEATGWNFWSFAFVTLAIVSFQLLLEPYGLLVSMAALIGLTALAGRDTTLKELAVFSAILIPLSIGLFIYGLKIPIRVLTP